MRLGSHALNTKARYTRTLAPPPNFEFTEKNQDGRLWGEQQGTLSICYSRQKQYNLPINGRKYQ